MSTPARRATERRPHFETRKGNLVPVPPINPDTRTARDLAADPRVESLDFDAVPDKVVITLNSRWQFECGSPDVSGYVHVFDLWEQARNAVRRAIGPSIRDLKAEAAAGHLDKDAC